jgi:hypothetical protein
MSRTLVLVEYGLPRTCRGQRLSMTRVETLQRVPLVIID